MEGGTRPRRSEHNTEVRQLAVLAVAPLAYPAWGPGEAAVTLQVAESEQACEMFPSCSIDHRLNFKCTGFNKILTFPIRWGSRELSHVVGVTQRGSNAPNTASSSRGARPRRPWPGHPRRTRGQRTTRRSPSSRPPRRTRGRADAGAYTRAPRRAEEIHGDGLGPTRRLFSSSPLN